MFPTTAAMAGPGSPAAPLVFNTATATTPPLPAQQSTPPTGALNALTAAVYSMQRQIDDLSARLAVLAGRPSLSAQPWVRGIPAFPAAVPVVPESFSAPRVLPVSSAPVSFPSFTAPSPVPPQQHCEGLFYWGVDGIQVAAASCWRPVVLATVALPPLGKKAFAQEDVCHVSAAVRLQAAARGLLARCRLQDMRRQMHVAALTAVDLGKGGRVLVPSDGHQQSRRSAAGFMREQGVISAVSELQLCGSGGRGGSFPSLSLAGTHCLAPLFSATGRREDVSAGRGPD